MRCFDSQFMERNTLKNQVYLSLDFDIRSQIESMHFNNLSHFFVLELWVLKHSFINITPF